MSEVRPITRLRSPPYPTLSLQKAIERTEQLYRQERDHLVPISSAAKAWGMSPTSSGPLVTIGALKQYGLVDDEGSGDARKLHVTRDALRIILDKMPSSEPRKEALRRAFFTPKIFVELWGNYKADLPSDQTVLNYLILERRLNGAAPFTDTAAAELLANYRASLAFAMPENDSTVPALTETSAEETAMEPSIPPAERPEGMPSQPSPATTHPSRVRLAENERVVFVEEGDPNQYLKLIASGELDEIMLDALSDYISRQKRRLNRPN